ncbi:ribonuclease Y-like [Phoenix dactylifera]|uniref:Ribonuclease Y-like n=1 Tax=Phoenix dactylifera TaxID=42345 RepID=A0A8B7C872_PHODC|nr:ribonuclease Y-like [Phoenix dactylifera]
MDKLLLHGRRSSTLKTSMALISLGNTLRNSYSTESKEEHSLGIGQKARSTAEEFSRQAKEKAEKISETTKEAWEDAKEAVVGETQQEKEKLKEKVEKGNYDKIGRE